MPFIAISDWRDQSSLQQQSLQMKLCLTSQFQIPIGCGTGSRTNPLNAYCHPLSQIKEEHGGRMSALGHKQTCAMQNVMSALLLITTVKANIAYGAQAPLVSNRGV